MKIVEIIPQLSSGGAERFVVDLCNELCQRHDVTLITYYDLINHGFYAAELSPSVKVISMNKSEGFSFALFNKVHKVIRILKPDVIHLHSRAIYYAFPSVIMSQAASYMTIHNDAEKEAGNWLGKMLRKIFFRKGHITPVTISPESLNSFISFYGYSAPMIPNGRNVDVNMPVPEDLVEEFGKYRRTSSTKVLVNIARMTSVKRQDMLARIVDRLVKEGYDICLLLIGRLGDDEVLKRVRAVSCDRIHILGEKTNPTEYLKLSDAFCLCSSYEGMPISLIEAMGMGVIPICTPVGGIVDVINEDNGFLSYDDSEEAYYQAVKKYLNTGEQMLDMMKEMVFNAYLPYMMSGCAERYEDLFREAAHE